jgi:hypothetical protein
VLSASSADRWARRTWRTRTLEPIGDAPPEAFEAGMKPNVLVSKNPGDSVCRGRGKLDTFDDPLAGGESPQTRGS